MEIRRRRERMQSFEIGIMSLLVRFKTPAAPNARLPGQLCCVGIFGEEAVPALGKGHAEIGNGSRRIPQEAKFRLADFIKVQMRRIRRHACTASGCCMLVKQKIGKRILLQDNLLEAAANE